MVVTQPQQPQPVGIVVPPELEVGVYANLVAVWHTPTEFALDFLTNVPGTTPIHQPDGTVRQAAKLKAVARVKLPPAQIFELMKALEQQLSGFESEAAARKAAQLPPDGPVQPPFTAEGDDMGDTGDTDRPEPGKE